MSAKQKGGHLDQQCGENGEPERIHTRQFGVANGHQPRRNFLLAELILTAIKAEADLQHEASKSMPDIDDRAVIVLGIQPSENALPSTSRHHDLSQLRPYFSKILAEVESVSVCKAYHVGAMTTNDVHFH